MYNLNLIIKKKLKINSKEIIFILKEGEKEGLYMLLISHVTAHRRLARHNEGYKDDHMGRVLV